MSKILQFPKSKSKRAENLLNKETRKFVTLASILSLVLVGLFFNETLTQTQRQVYYAGDGTDLDRLNRAIASARPVTLYRDLEWEQQMAQKLNGELTRQPSSTTARIQLIDQLRYGELRGKYRLVQEYAQGPSLVKEIEYIESLDAGDKPILLADTKTFLQQYRDVFTVSFESSELDQGRESKQEGSEVYKLYNADKKQVGRAAVQIDKEGRLLSVRLSASEK